jgi:hypothetical protein
MTKKPKAHHAAGLCQLEEADIDAFPGTTLFTKPGTPCLKPSAIYLSSKDITSRGQVDVVIWLHGYKVHDHKFLFQHDPSQIREQIRDSGANVVLIAPWLGFEFRVGKLWQGNYNEHDLAKPGWGERYFNQMLQAIADFEHGNSTSQPEAGNPRPHPPEVGRLVIAAHSAGGRAMRAFVQTLGRYQSKLTACWGLDCLYGIKPKVDVKGTKAKDDATFWLDWAAKHERVKLDVIYGDSTVPQSVKLDLINRGIITPEGDRVEKPKGFQAEQTRKPLENIKVTIGYFGAIASYGKMTMVDEFTPPMSDRFEIPHPADIAMTNFRKHGEYLKLAIERVLMTFPFDKDKIHYMIARGAFRDRLVQL